MDGMHRQHHNDVITVIESDRLTTERTTTPITPVVDPCRRIRLYLHDLMRLCKRMSCWSAKLRLLHTHTEQVGRKNGQPTDRRESTARRRKG